MPLDLISGRAAAISLGSDFSYAATANGPVAIKDQIISMRLDGKPVHFRTRSLPNISDNDEVAAAGRTKNGTLEAVAIRNFTTGAIYHPPTTVAMILAAVLILIGLPLIAILIGFFFVGFGVFVLLKALRIRKAVALLQQHTMPATTTPAALPTPIAANA